MITFNQLCVEGTCHASPAGSHVGWSDSLKGMSTREAVLERLLAHGKGAGLVMDFDGVLSPIIADPASSQLLEGASEVLEALTARLGVVALLSGRPVSFLAARVPVPAVMLLGSYGTEQQIDGHAVVMPEIRAWLPQVRSAKEELLSRFAGMAGIHVEDKDWSVAVHWRQAPDRDEAERLVEEAVHLVSQETGLHCEPGKFVLELRPPVSADKGTALRRLAGQTSCTTFAYAGDDRGDLPAFAAVTEMGGSALVVHGPEMAVEVSDVAGVHFENPRDFVDWLHHLNQAFG